MNAHERIDTFFNIRHFSDRDNLTFSRIETVSSVFGGGCQRIKLLLGDKLELNSTYKLPKLIFKLNCKFAF